MDTVCDTGAVSVYERVDWFATCQLSARQPMRVHSPHPTRFRAVARDVDLGDVGVAGLTCTSARLWRGRRLTDREHAPTYSVVMPIRGSLGLEHRGRQTVLTAGRLALYDSRQPVCARFPAATDLLQVQLPTGMVGVRPDRIDRLLGVSIPATSGLAALLNDAAARCLTDAATYRPADRGRVAAVLADLVTATIAHELEADTVQTPVGAQALLAAIDDFIGRRLHDPDLTPAEVAAAHHISISYLHRLFRSRGITVAASIKQRRLELARRDLADPQLAGVSVQRIAARRGFADHATFTRAFRAAFDLTPSDYRHSRTAQLQRA